MSPYVYCTNPDCPENGVEKATGDIETGTPVACGGCEQPCIWEDS